jgi:hypothetical protein
MTEIANDTVKKSEINDAIKNVVKDTVISMLPAKKQTSERQLLHLKNAREAKKRKQMMMDIDEEHRENKLVKMSKNLKEIQDDVKYLKRKHEDYNFEEIAKAIKQRDNESAGAAIKPEPSKKTFTVIASEFPKIGGDNQLWLLATLASFAIGSGAYIYNNWPDSGSVRGGTGPDIYRL